MQATIQHGLLRRNQSKLRKSIQLARFFFIQKILNAQIFNLCRQLNLVVADIKGCNRRNAAAALFGRRKTGLRCMANRCYRPQAGNNHPSFFAFFHICLNSLLFTLPCRRLRAAPVQ